MAVEDDCGEAHVMHLLLQQLTSLEHLEAQLAGLKEKVLFGSTGRHVYWWNETQFWHETFSNPHHHSLLTLLEHHHLTPVHALDATHLAQLLQRHPACPLLENSEVSILNHSLKLVPFAFHELFCELQTGGSFEAVESEVDVSMKQFADGEKGIQ